LGARKAITSLNLADENGKTRLMLSVIKDGPLLGMADENGNPLVTFGVNKNGPSLNLLSPDLKLIWRAP